MPPPMGRSCARLANLCATLYLKLNPRGPNENVKRHYLCVCTLGGLLLLPAFAAAAKKSAHSKSEPAGGASQDQSQAIPTRVAVLELASLGLPEEMRRNLQILLNNSIRTNGQHPAHRHPGRANDDPRPQIRRSQQLRWRPRLRRAHRPRGGGRCGGVWHPRQHRRQL